MVAPGIGDVLGRILGDAWSPAVEAGRSLESLGIDSVRLVELVLELEAAYGVEIPDACLVAENFSTVASVETMMRSLSP